MRVLVLDDEKNIVTVLQAILEKRGFTVDGSTEPSKALQMLAEHNYAAVITDLQMPEMDGMHFLRAVHKLRPDLPVIMITAYGTVDSAVDAIKQGAFDYVTKPFEQSEIALVVQKAVSTQQLRQLELQKTAELSESPLINGRGERMQELQKRIRKVAATPSTIIIFGESGTGKEIIAEEIHKYSPRSAQALLKVNCSALSGEFLEQELFGNAQRLGRFQQAQGGTLFIDDISEMSAEVQFRLFEFLENPPAGFDVRLIVASQIDLQPEVSAGNFREDLFYKLNVLPLFVPSLRERPEDFSEIVHYLLQRLSIRLQQTAKKIDPACIDALAKLSWPGNLRQLEQVLERMLLLSDAITLQKADIPKDLKANSTATDKDPKNFREHVRRQTQSLERDLIAKALEEQEGNITRTAERLGLSRKGLQLKMKELGIKS